MDKKAQPAMVGMSVPIIERCTMSYPLRYPFSWFLARIGITITININFIYDDEENVFVATSRDIQWLVLEAENFNT
ncbi:hypothetical protein PN36_24035 [Candidatus Thiomargarita nelsonii]|uniref:DUF1902 domain-containing protein n=1 Tax=Candidatus Thiomargarita nelsonii TaxID=1003181 RepID=A0A4E0QY96_9GAMM|nr:hypothetical protein PN36_27395 [Candidatus Thiomargarita nelsonii]TGO02495.1 hypothetical protein PN36_24035 [Candidatus Thiomargarita nelsonii]